MKVITVNKEQLKMLLDNVDELAQYIEQLVNWAYEYGKEQGGKQ